MPEMAGLVSVVIPAYNSAKYLSAAIDSALSQTYPLVEVIVVDDGSTDESAAICEGYSDRIRYIYQANAGLSAARNRGIHASGGEYLWFLDADDRILPDAVATMAGALGRHPECAVAYGGYYQMDEDGARFGQSALDQPSGRVFEQIIVGGIPMVVHVAVVRMAALAKSGLFDPMLPQLEDLDFWIRLSYYDDFVFVPEYVAEYRSTPGSMSRNRHEQRFASELLLMKTAAFLKAKQEPVRLLQPLRKRLYRQHPQQCVQDAFMHYWAGRDSLAFRSMLEGVMAGPRYLANRGVLSVLARALKRSVAAWFRRRGRTGQ